jgi:hypothetical protein
MKTRKVFLKGYIELHPALFKGRNPNRHNRQTGNKQASAVGQGVILPLVLQAASEKKQKRENGKCQHQGIHRYMNAEKMNGTEHSFPLYV